MRLWSLDPKYLDAKGLVALWREALLAKKVLEGKTKGYKNHPQLKRFKNYKYPIKSINTYLYYIFLESRKRGYNFNKSKCENFNLKKVIIVTSGQVEFELNHLRKKLKLREKSKLKDLNEKITVNKLFKIKPGKIEDWEKN